MTISGPNFLKSIKFEEKFLPFGKGTEIKFDGDKEVQRMIQFYLKDKEIKDSKGKIISAEDNAKRFKINCVLGNNGGGKSRLFEGMHESQIYKQSPDDLGWKSKGIGNEKIRLKNWKTNDIYNEIISDDFFKLSGNIGWSVNNNSLNIKEGDIKNIISKFLFLEKKGIHISEYFFQKKLPAINIISSTKGYYFDLSKIFIFNFIDPYQENNTLPKFYARIGGGATYNKNCITKIIKKGLINFKNYGDNIYGLLIKKIVVELILLSINSRIKIEIGDILKLNINENTSKELDEKIYKLLFNGINEDYIEEEIEAYKQYIKDLKNKINYFSEKDIRNNTGEKSFNDNFNLGILISKLFSEFEFQEFEYIIKNILWNFDFTYGSDITFSQLSAGEKTILLRFSNLYMEIFNKYTNEYKTNFLILIDEPDLHLHLDWQRQYIQKLIDVFSTLDPEINIHFIIATHSPFIISDLPKESLVLLNKGEQVDNKEIPETFGANYIDIIKNGFFFEDKKFMGSFAEDIIGEVAQSKRKILMDIPDKNDKEIMNQIEENIGDKFLKNNLVYFKSKKYDKSGD